MSDNGKNRGPADRARINIHEAYEVEYWSNELGITAERLREPVGKHGVMAAAVAQAIDKYLGAMPSSSKLAGFEEPESRNTFSNRRL